MVNYISIIIAMAMSSMTNIGYPKIINSSWARVDNKNNFTKSPLLYSINK